MSKLNLKRIDSILMVAVIVLGIKVMIDSLLSKDYATAIETFVMVFGTGMVVLQLRSIQELRNKIQVKNNRIKIQAEQLAELQKQLENKEED